MRLDGSEDESFQWLVLFCFVRCVMAANRTRGPYTSAAARGAEDDDQLDPRFVDSGDDSSWGEASDSEDEGKKDPKNLAGTIRSPRGSIRDGPKEGADEMSGPLMAELKEKKRQVYELSVLLEALEPVPGLNADKFLDILTQPNSEHLDYRDSKIVHLAKKCRNLTVALTQSKNRHAVVWKELQDLKAANFAEGESGSARGSSAGKKTPTEEGKRSDGDVKKQQEAAVSGLQKQVTELRQRLERSQDEVKRLQRVVVKEVGEEGAASDSKVMEPGWRGRAQQIVMLRAKVKRLEAQLGERKAAAGGAEGPPSEVASVASSCPGSAPREPSSARGSTAPMDVDRKAEADVAHIERERAKMAEQAVGERVVLQGEVANMRRKLEASRARVSYLEADMGKLKEQMRCLLKKARTDDDLIDAQRQELERLHRSRRMAAQEGMRGQRRLACPPGGHKSEERKRLESDLGMDGVDMALVCAAAGAEERPEDVIRRLRVRMKAAANPLANVGQA